MLVVTSGHVWTKKGMVEVWWGVCERDDMCLSVCGFSLVHACVHVVWKCVLNRVCEYHVRLCPVSASRKRFS